MRATARPAAPATGLAYITGSGQPPSYSVWLASADGRGAHRLGPGFDPLLSPDGQEVAAATENDSSLVVYSSAGTVLRRFFVHAHVSAEPLAWSPDSRHLAVGVHPLGSSTSHPPSLAVIDMRTAAVTTVADGNVEGVSFAPSGPERFAFALTAPAAGLPDRSDLYEAWIGRRQVMQLTHDRRSLEPVWGARGIVFDRSTPRTHAGLPSAPEDQLFLLLHGHVRQITHMKVFWLAEGLIPAAISADGSRLAANLLGEDMDQGWSVNLVTGQLHEFPTGLTADGVSRDGRRVLLETMYGWLNSPRKSVIETMPFAGGRATLLVKPGGNASWNQ